MSVRHVLSKNKRITQSLAYSACLLTLSPAAHPATQLHSRDPSALRTLGTERQRRVLTSVLKCADTWGLSRKRQGCPLRRNPLGPPDYACIVRRDTRVRQPASSTSCLCFPFTPLVRPEDSLSCGRASSWQSLTACFMPVDYFSLHAFFLSFFFLAALALLLFVPACSSGDSALIRGAEGLTRVFRD